MESFKEAVASASQPMQNAFAVCPAWLQIGVAAVGGLYLSTQLLNFGRLLLSLTVLSGTNLRKYGPKGTWAVITGASDGLGKEFAKQLAAKGFNLVLVSRTESKLSTLANELEAKHAGLRTKVLAMDFSQDNDADYARLAQLVEGVDVGILLNNVGQSHDIPVSFLETKTTELKNIVTINCIGTLRTTQVVAAGMVQRKRGLILTMGSFGGWMPTPYLATYSGSKAFLQQWSSSLASELQPANVDVYLVLSYLVCSAMSKVRRPNLMTPTPARFVKAALGKVGVGSQAMASTYTPYWSHAVMQWVVERTVGVGAAMGIKVNRDMHIDIRRRALRKAQRNAKKE